MSSTEQKSGVELIAGERAKGYNNLKEEKFASDFEVLNKGVQYAYKTKSNLTAEVLIKGGALIAAELDRLNQYTPPQEHPLLRGEVEEAAFNEALRYYPYTNEGDMEDEIDSAKRRLLAAGFIAGAQYQASKASVSGTGFYIHKESDDNALYYSPKKGTWVNAFTGEGENDVMLEDYMIPATFEQVCGHFKRMQKTIKFNVDTNMVLIKHIGERAVAASVSEGRGDNIEYVKGWKDGFESGKQWTVTGADISLTEQPTNTQEKGEEPCCSCGSPLPADDPYDGYCTDCG